MDDVIPQATIEQREQFLRGVEYGWNPLADLTRQLFDFPQVTTPIVYHYTSHQGLVGILRDEILWATKVSFVNDKTEMHYGSNYVKRFLDATSEALKKASCPLDIANEENLKLREIMQSATPGSPEHKEALDKLNEFDLYRQNSLLGILLEFLSGTHTPPKEFDMYVVSFSEERDIASQWLAYGEKGRGYSVGFTSTNLARASYKDVFKYNQCIYDPEAQRQLLLRGISALTVNNWFLQLLTDEGLHGNTGMGMDWAKSVLSSYLGLCVPFFKHPSFKNEKEWRVVIPEESIDYQETRFRMRHETRIPYKEFCLYSPANEAWHYLPITEIVVGSQISESELEEVKEIAKEVGYGNVPFIRSETPL